jgi:hypothetical protein
MVTFYDVIDYLTLLSPVMLLTGLVSGIRYFRSLSKPHKVVVWYLFLALVTDLMTRFYVFSNDNNLVFILIFSLLELLLFAVLYFLLFSGKRNPVLLFLVPAGIVYIVWELLSQQFVATEQFQSYAKVVDTFLVLTLSVSYFFERLRKTKDEVWRFFRLNAIVLVFFAFHLIFFLPLNFLIREDSNIQFALWLVNLAVTVTFYVFLTSELWRNGSIRKQLQSG